MGPLIILLAIGIAMAALVWRSRSVSASRSVPARRDARGDSVGNDGTFNGSGSYGRHGTVWPAHAGGDITGHSATFYDTSVYDGGAEAPTGHADTHCSDSGAGFSGDCGGDGGGSSGD